MINDKEDLSNQYKASKMLSLSGGIDHGRRSAGSSLCGVKINQLIISKMNILDRAARAESYSNASSSIVDSGICESAGKSDSLVSEISVSIGNKNHAHRS